MRITHGGLDPGNLSIFVKNLVDAGVEHIGSTIDGRKTSETLRELTEAVKGIDIWRLSVARHGVHVKANAIDSLDGGSRLVNVVVRLVESHRMADEIASVIFEAELVINLLHGALRNIQA